MLRHFIIRCSCGAVISQCRCPATDKHVAIADKACEKCKAKEREQ